MILTLVEHEADAASATSLEALTLARQIAVATGEPLHALAIAGDAGKLAPSLGDHGVEVLHAASFAGDEAYAPRAWARAVLALVGAGAPKAVAAPASDRGNEVMAYVGAIAGLPMVANCVEVAPDADGVSWRLRRLRWAGSIVEEAVLRSEGPGLFTVAADSIAAEAGGAPVVTEVRAFGVALEERDLEVRVAEVLEPATEGVSLTDARVVVGGGRGVGGEEGFAVLEELAELLGGAVGVSRAVTSLGWRSHQDQVGQTGCRIAPELYIACGISGAIQHMVGCKGARNLLAINTDADAPIMSKADYAVIGDLHAVLPAVVAELRKERAR
ncbi:MAG TPA: electron transfer flavoprotein subunit alpha/FixB family protein [Acidimicrobiales bacterium]|nr:electron transfer flavoprotein subunit alpha/FixB family protein [Acidimicrobiales bacterium]